MPPRRKKKHKVVMRRTRVAYRWRFFGETMALWFKRLVFVGSAMGLAWGAYGVWEKAVLLTVTGVEVQGPLLSGWAEAPPVKKGQPLFSFSVDQIEQRIRERYPQLRSVRVRRAWDRSVRIQLELRTPVAKISVGPDRWNGVDSGGVLFPLEGAGAHLPILSLPKEEGTTATALPFLAALRAAKESWTDGLYKLKISSDGDGVLYLAGDVPLHWGKIRTDPHLVAQKARRFGRVLLEPEAIGGIDNARFVDDHRVVIQPRGTVVQKKERHG